MLDITRSINCCREFSSKNHCKTPITRINAPTLARSSWALIFQVVQENEFPATIRAIPRIARLRVVSFDFRSSRNVIGFCFVLGTHLPRDGSLGRRLGKEKGGDQLADRSTTFEVLSCL